MTIEIALTGASVWPTPNPLAGDLPQMSWRLFQEATQGWERWTVQLAAEEFADSYASSSLAEHLDRYAQHVISQCFTDALVTYWERRGDEFDQIGNAAAEASDVAQRCFETAQACRHKASVVRMYGDPDLAEDIAFVLGELPKLEADRHQAIEQERGKWSTAA